MPVEMKCPLGHRLQVPSKLAGCVVVCPVCESKVDVPSKRDAIAREGFPSLPTQEHQQLTPTVDPAALVAPVTLVEPAGAIGPGQPQGALQPTIESAAAKTTDTEQVLPTDLSESVASDGSDSTVVEAIAPLATTQQRVESNHDPSRFLSDLGSRDEFFTTEQSRLFDEVASERNSHPAWVVVDTMQAEEQNQKRVQRNDRHVAAFGLSVVALAVAIGSVIPPALQHINCFQTGDTPDGWTYFVLLAALIQIAVAVFATSIPDWSTQWISTLATTGMAAFYALGLALTMFARQDHALLGELGLLDEAFHNQAQPWCFLIMCTMLILAYCYGRFSLRWCETDRKLHLSRSETL